jgi:hypothetical protein
MNYSEAKEIFSRARNKTTGYKLGNNTRLVETQGGYGVKLHNTIVVDIQSDGTYILNTGGWFTKTTKDRINSYAPVNLYTGKRIWYLSPHQTFSDGIVVNSKGKVIRDPNAKQVKRIKAMHEKINKYVDKYAKALKENKVPQPSCGDCWGCCMVDASGKTVMGHDHLEQHLKESYLVPSLLVNAIRAKGYNPAYVNPWNGLRNDVNTFKRAIKDYLIKELAK